MGGAGTDTLLWGIWTLSLGCSPYVEMSQEDDMGIMMTKVPPIWEFQKNCGVYGRVFLSGILLFGVHIRCPRLLEIPAL